MNNKLEINLKNGSKLVAEIYNYDGVHPEITVYIEEDNLVAQDICLVKPSEDYEYNIECLVWGDDTNEDYTDRFVIPQI